MFRPPALCEGDLYDAHQLGGLKANSPYIEILSPTKGKVNRAPLGENAYPYSLECFSDGCFELPGVWTEYPVVSLPPPSPPYDGCYEEGVFENCTSVCQVEVLTPYLPCFEDGAYEEGAYNYLWQRETRYISPPNGQPCFPPDNTPPVQVTQDWEPYLHGRVWGRLYNRDIFPGFPIYRDCIEGECIQDVPTYNTPNKEWLVIDSGPYEEGVFQSDVYRPTSFIYTKSDSIGCYDPCVFDEWQLLGAWDCIGNERRPSIPPRPPNIWDEGQVTKLSPEVNVISRTFPPFEEGVYERDVYYPWQVLWLDGGTPLIYSHYLNNERVYIRPANLLPDLDDIYQYVIGQEEPYGFENCFTLGLEGCDIAAIAYNLLPPCVNPQEVALTPCVECTPSVINGYLHRWVYRKGKWYSQFFIKGAGPDGIAYSLDIGYIHPLCLDGTVIREDNVPLYPDGTFSIPTDLGGPLYIRLKAFSLYGWTLVAEYRGLSPLPRTYEHGTLTWYAEGQYCYIKDTCIALILLLLSPYYPDPPCSGVYGWRPPHFLDYVGNVLRHLVTLIYRQGGAIEGSIPTKVYSHSTYDTLYSSRPIQCPDVYLEGVYAANCMEDYYWGDGFQWVGDELPSQGCDCFEKGYEAPPLDLTVTSESVAWLMYACGVYTHLDYDPQIVQGMRSLAGYLYRTLDIKTGLVKDSHLDNRVSTVTNSISALAFMKAYDVLQEAPFLEMGADLYWAINEYLYSPIDIAFYKDLTTPNPDVETILSGLILSWNINKVDAIEKGINTLTTMGYPCMPGVRSLVSTNNNPIKLRSNRALTVQEVCQRVVPLQDSETLGMSSWVSLYLITNTLLRDEYRVSYSPLIRLHQGNTPGVLQSALCLTLPNMGLDNYITRVHCLPELERVLFHRHYVYDSLKYMWPVDFTTWANASALTLKGLIGRTLNASAVALATWYGFVYTFVSGVYLEGSRVGQLDTWGDDLSLPRYRGEDDAHYRLRLSYVLKGLDDSRDIDLISLADHLGYNLARVSELSIQGTLSPIHPHPYFNPVLGSYLHGGDAVAGVTTLEVAGHLTTEEGTRFQRAKAAGVKLYLQDRVYMGDCNRTKALPACVNWEGEALPTALVEPYCCSTGHPCGDPHVVTLSHPSNQEVYVWQEGEGYKTGYSAPDGVNIIHVFMPGDTYKVIFI